MCWKEATIARVRETLRMKDQIVPAEAHYARTKSCSLILADIPFLAGDIAEAAGIPAIGVSNFTWDFIYETYLQDEPDREAILESLRASYAKLKAFIQLPFHHEIEGIADTFEVNLMAQTTPVPEEQILSGLGIAPGDQRSVVLFGMRSGVLDVPRIARCAPEFLFCFPGPAADWPENARPIPQGPGLGFIETMKIAEVAVSKLGFGILADCIAARTALVFPIKEAFREDEYTQRAAARHLRSCPLSRQDYESGHWSTALRAVLAQPAPVDRIPLDGASQCAAVIARYL